MKEYGAILTGNNANHALTSYLCGAQTQQTSLEFLMAATIVEKSAEIVPSMDDFKDELNNSFKKISEGWLGK